jgi:hypothetical protein
MPHIFCDSYRMARKEYTDPTKANIFIDNMEPALKEDFLDICYKFDANYREGFDKVVREYCKRHKIKPRPSRPKG